MSAVALATVADEPGLRALARETPMPGAPALCLEREPDYFRGLAVGATAHRTVVARDPATGMVVGCGSRVTHPVWLGGAPAEAEYLGGLRAADAARGHPGWLRRAFALLLEDLPPGRPCYTSIMEGNRAARRLLEAGLRGMPVYRHVGSLVTCLLPAGGGPGEGAGPATVAPEEVLDRRRTRDLALRPFPSTIGVPAGSCVQVEEGGEVVALGILWDQRDRRQVRVHGYPPVIRHLRGPINLWQRLRGGPRLPPAGTTLAMGFLSLLWVRDDEPGRFDRLLTRARRLARERGLDLLALGIRAGSTLMTARRLRPALRFASRIYTVAPAGSEPVAIDPGCEPEVAVL